MGDARPFQPTNDFDGGRGSVSEAGDPRVRTAVSSNQQGIRTLVAKWPIIYRLEYKAPGDLNALGKAASTCL